MRGPGSYHGRSGGESFSHLLIWTLNLVLVETSNIILSRAGKRSPVPRRYGDRIL